MTLVTIDLQEGFVNDTVVVCLNDKKIFMDENVTTRLQIGLAHRIEVQTEKINSKIEIELPLKNTVITKIISTKKNSFIGVSLKADNTLTLHEQSHEFRYA